MKRRTKWLFVGSSIFMLLGVPTSFGMSKVKAIKEFPEENEELTGLLGCSWFSQKNVLIVAEGGERKKERGCIGNIQPQQLLQF